MSIAEQSRNELLTEVQRFEKKLPLIKSNDQFTARLNYPDEPILLLLDNQV